MTAVSATGKTWMLRQRYRRKHAQYVKTLPRGFTLIEFIAIVAVGHHLADENEGPNTLWSIALQGG